jgi:hypothetical protein
MIAFSVDYDAEVGRLVPSFMEPYDYSALYCRCGFSRAHCVKRISSVAMSTIRSVSGHVSLIRYLPPTPLRSIRVTGLRRSYRRLRLPIITASSLAF